jgi:hypothetical protein
MMLQLKPEKLPPEFTLREKILKTGDTSLPFTLEKEIYEASIRQKPYFSFSKIDSLVSLISTSLLFDFITRGSR